MLAKFGILICSTASGGFYSMGNKFSSARGASASLRGRNVWGQVRTACVDCANASADDSRMEASARAVGMLKAGVPH